MDTFWIQHQGSQIQVQQPRDVVGWAWVSRMLPSKKEAKNIQIKTCSSFLQLYKVITPKWSTPKTILQAGLDSRFSCARSPTNAPTRWWVSSVQSEFNRTSLTIQPTISMQKMRIWQGLGLGLGFKILPILHKHSRMKEMWRIQAAWCQKRRLLEIFTDKIWWELCLECPKMTKFCSKKPKTGEMWAKKDRLLVSNSNKTVQSI